MKLKFFTVPTRMSGLFFSGDVEEIAANIEHWHGATAISWFSHWATNGDPKTKENEWLEPVTTAVYKHANDKKI